MSQTHPEPNLDRSTVSTHNGYLLLSVADDAYADEGGWCHSLHHYEDGKLVLIEVGGNNGLLIRKARLLREAHQADSLLKKVAEDAGKLAADKAEAAD